MWLKLSSGMKTQVSEMTMVDYFKGVHSTGMDRVFVEAEQRRQEYNERVAESGPIAARVPMSIEETIARLISIGLFLGFWYYGVNVMLVPWYWAFGVGLVSGLLAEKLFMGPLFFVLILLKWLLAITVVGGLIYLFTSG
jgi:hypothetical protein